MSASPRMQKQHPLLITILAMREASDSMAWLDGLDNWRQLRGQMLSFISTAEEVLKNLKEKP